MKKYINYAGLLLTGLLLGWILFGPEPEKDSVDVGSDQETVSKFWTCSMHPQIVLPEPGICPICNMDLIPVEEGGVGLSKDQFKLTNNAIALANIQTMIIGKNDTSESEIILTGKIVQNEEANMVQVSYFSGRLELLNVNFTGDKIRQGQLLATIYSPELIAAQQELIIAAETQETQPALYSAVRNKLKLWKLTEDQINTIEASAKPIENFPIYATVSGTVVEKLVEQGESIKQGQPLLKISNLSTVWASFDVFENQIKLFKKGQSIDIESNAFPGKTFKAKISFVDPVMNTQTRTVQLRAVLDNMEEIFKPGMFIKGQITSKATAPDSTLLIPSTAILWTGKRSVVYVKTSQKEPIFEMREVTLGADLGINVEVIDGLNSGEEVVTNGAFTVDAAAQLQGKRSMMNNTRDSSEMRHRDHYENQSSIDQLDPSKRIQVSEGFQRHLKDIFNDYIKLKNSLVQDDAIVSRDASKSLMAKLNETGDDRLKGSEGLEKWAFIKKELKENTNRIIESEEINEQRHYFKNVSVHLTRAIQLFGINQKVYHQFCPMADNNNGAYWLSFEKEVLNPYFGSAMIKCGSIKGIIE